MFQFKQQPESRCYLIPLLTVLHYVHQVSIQAAARKPLLPKTIRVPSRLADVSIQAAARKPLLPVKLFLLALCATVSIQAAARKPLLPVGKANKAVLEAVSIQAAARKPLLQVPAVSHGIRISFNSSSSPKAAATVGAETLLLVSVSKSNCAKPETMWHA